MWVSTVLGLRNRCSPIARLERPSAISREHLALAIGKARQRSGIALALHEAGDDRRVEHGLALRDPAQRVPQDGDVGHPVLEQVPDALGMLLEQSHRVDRLEVVRQDEHADFGVRVADFVCREYALIGVRRRHLDIDDRHVGTR